MTAPIPNSAVSGRVLAIIMGGGQGSRLYPLTLERSKPAVPLAGKYRLVDIPISNCINSEIRRMYLLTQFNTASLHHHVYGSFKFDHFSGGFVEILAAEQTPTDTSWYQGTADAVRKNIIHFRNVDFDYALILSGDQLYRMDFRTILARHVEEDADITISTIPVEREDAKSLGIMRTDAAGRITRFEEKPREAELLDQLGIDPEACKQFGLPEGKGRFLASMGIYVFKRNVLFELLENQLTDFGKDIIPGAIETHRVYSHVFQGYWEDIGTIRSFFEANLDLVSELPRFNFFDMDAPIYTRARFLPGSKINGAIIDHALISDGCILNRCKIERSIIGIRSLIDEGSQIKRSIVVGSDKFESETSIRRHAENNRPRIGIGRKTRIENTIIDKNARVGDECVITPAGKPDPHDDELYVVRDGIVIIPKGTVIPHGTKI